MNIKIETYIEFPTDLEIPYGQYHAKTEYLNMLKELNSIVMVCTRLNSITEIISNQKSLFDDNIYFQVGYGSAHVFVSLKSSGERILLITD